MPFKQKYLGLIVSRQTYDDKKKLIKLMSKIRNNLW